MIKISATDAITEAIQQQGAVCYLTIQSPAYSLLHDSEPLTNANQTTVLGQGVSAKRE